jgi:hypothetical protein
MARLQFSLRNFTIVSTVMPAIVFAMYSTVLHYQYVAFLEEVELNVAKEFADEEAGLPDLHRLYYVVGRSPKLKEPDRARFLARIDEKIKLRELARQNEDQSRYACVRGPID